MCLIATLTAILWNLQMQPKMWDILDVIYSNFLLHNMCVGLRNGNVWLLVSRNVCGNQSTLVVLETINNNVTIYFAKGLVWCIVVTIQTECLHAYQCSTKRDLTNLVFNQNICKITQNKTLTCM